MTKATAIAHPNIALCKYWGKRERALNLPATPSLSLTVAPFSTRTTVEWGAERDEVHLNGAPAGDKEAKKVLAVLDLIDSWRPKVRVESVNDFPTAAGLASSSSGFAALVVAAVAAAGQTRPPEELSVLARRGSGSACRSIYGGWAEWKLGTRPDGADSHGIQVAPEDHWDVRLVVAVFGAGPKAISSRDGMNLTQETSPYYGPWVASAPRDVEEARRAVLNRDLATLAKVTERSTLRMHASMMAADPPVFYWKSGTVWAIEVIENLRKKGVVAAYTMDAGPNVKVLCHATDAEEVAYRLQPVAEDVRILQPGGPARLVD